jgi:hypothetical protein
MTQPARRTTSAVVNPTPPGQGPGSLLASISANTAPRRAATPSIHIKASCYSSRQKQADLIEREIVVAAEVGRGSCLIPAAHC